MIHDVVTLLSQIYETLDSNDIMKSRIKFGIKNCNQNLSTFNLKLDKNMYILFIDFVEETGYIKNSNDKIMWIGTIPELIDYIKHVLKTGEI